MKVDHSCASFAAVASDFLGVRPDPNSFVQRKVFMKENVILFQVSQIVSATNSFAGAVDQIGSLFEQVLGAPALTLLGAGELGDTPLKGSFYAAPLRASGRELGKLLVGADVPQRVSNYVGEQLGMLLERTRLRKDRSRLQAELVSLRDDLATRKVVQRAQGILVVRRGLTPASAKLWMSQQARQTRFSVQQIAEQIVAAENAQRESLFTPSRQRRIAWGILTGPEGQRGARDEAQYLVQLYKKYHDQGLEIVALDFEEPEQQDDLNRVQP
jgi:hypothetical protein